MEAASLPLFFFLPSPPPLRDSLSDPNATTTPLLLLLLLLLLPLLPLPPVLRQSKMPPRAMTAMFGKGQGSCTSM